MLFRTNTAIVALAATLSGQNAGRVVRTVMSWLWASETLAAYVKCWGDVATALTAFVADGPRRARDYIAHASWWLDSQAAVPSTTSALAAVAAAAAAAVRPEHTTRLLDQAVSLFRVACNGAARARLEVFRGMVFGEGSPHASINHVAELEDLFTLASPVEMSSKFETLLSTAATTMDRRELELALELKTIADLYVGMYESPENMMDPRVQTQSFVHVVGLLACAGGRDVGDVRKILGTYTSGRLSLDALDEAK